MSASPPMVILSDEEDIRICEHEVALEKAKHAKEEWQRQREEEAERKWREAEAKKVWRDVEAKEAWRTAEAEAEKAWREMEAEEAQRIAEVEEARQKAKADEAAWKEAEKKKKAEASAVWQKQLELLSQRKVAVQITRAEEAQRASEAGEEVTLSGIMGYGKGKVLEKHVCMNCLRKGVECEWDEGG